ncbi:MAG TPA: four helix bundle protein [Bacteroidales bacterium]|nr:four helix bundle protein [Bacteroidales bacterium]
MIDDHDKVISFFRFEDLRVYHKALDYASWVQERAAGFFEKDKGLVSSRFCHAAQSIALNIAEGSARNKRQFVYYLKVSKSAIRDCLVFTSMVHQLQYFTDEDEHYSRNQLMELTKMLGALIGSLQKAGGFEDDLD